MAEDVSLLERCPLFKKPLRPRLEGFSLSFRIVCHRLAAEGPYNVSDKLKIELFHDRHNSTRPVGWKLVISTLLKTRTGSQARQNTHSLCRLCYPHKRFSFQSFDECTERMHEFLSPAAAHSSAPLPHSDRSVCVCVCVQVCTCTLYIPD